MSIDLNSNAIIVQAIFQMSAESLKMEIRESLRKLTTKKYFELLRQKKKMLTTKEKYRATDGDDSQEEEFINLALVDDYKEQKNSSQSSQVLATNLSHLTSDEWNSTLDKMKNELYNLHVSFKLMTKKNARFKSTIAFLIKRNSLLEIKLLLMKRMKKENLDASAEFKKEGSL